MMNKNELKTELLLVSKYCSLITQILNVHKQLSVNKMIFFAFLLKNKDNYYKELYSANTDNDIVIKAISQISGNYIEYCVNIKYIIEAIHLLIENKDIILQNSILMCKNEGSFNNTYNNNFIKKAIDESNNFSDRQFLKEVLSNV
ncbi:MAG: hypothetical protein J6N52_02220 [Clostridia bacterium]|nr:hypothetical protein [Clostridia bacterium]